MCKMFKFTFKILISVTLILAIFMVAFSGSKLFQKDTLENNYQTKTDIIIKVLEEKNDEGYKSY